MSSGKRHIDILCLADGLAIVERLDESQFVCMRIDDVGDLVEKGGTLLDRGLFPRGKGFPGCVYGSIDILRRGFCTAGKFVTSRRAKESNVLPSADGRQAPSMKRPY